LHFYVAASEDPWGTTVFEKDAVSSSSRHRKGEKPTAVSRSTTTRSAGNNISCKKKTKFSKTLEKDDAEKTRPMRTLKLDMSHDQTNPWCMMWSKGCKEDSSTQMHV
jgi:hypothetical protein